MLVGMEGESTAGLHSFRAGGDGLVHTTSWRHAVRRTNRSLEPLRATRATNPRGPLLFLIPDPSTLPPPTPPAPAVIVRMVPSPPRKHPNTSIDQCQLVRPGRKPFFPSLKQDEWKVRRLFLPEGSLPPAMARPLLAQLKPHFEAVSSCERRCTGFSSITTHKAVSAWHRGATSKRRPLTSKSESASSRCLEETLLAGARCSQALAIPFQKPRGHVLNSGSCNAVRTSKAFMSCHLPPSKPIQFLLLLWRPRQAPLPLPLLSHCCLRQYQ